MAVKFLNGIDVDGSLNIAASDVPNLDAGKINSGTLSTSRIPNLSASKITSGTINAARLPDLSGTYQPKGSYLTSIPAEYLTQTEGDARYLTSLPSHNHNGDYLEYSYSDVNMDTYDSDRSLLLGRNIGGWSSGTKPSGAHNGFGILHITTHEGGYATQFGFDTNQNKIWVRSKNPTSWGAWKYMWTEQDFSSTNVSNWNTAFGWGNHASAGYLKTLPTHSHSWASITGKPSTFTPSAHNHDSSYDAIGSADEVNVRIDNEIIPLIGTKADSSHTHSYLPLSGGTITGSLQVNGTMEVVGNRLGFVNSNFDAEIRVSDENPNSTGAVFDFYGDGVSRNATISAEFFDGVAANSNLLGGTSKASFLTNATASNDTITFTKGDGSTFAISTSDANTNYYLDGITKSGNTLTFSVNGTTNRTFTFGDAAFQDVASMTVAEAGYATDAGFANQSAFADVANSADAVPWAGVTGKPSTFPPSSHTHSYLPLSGGTLTGDVTFTGNNPQILFKESGANDAGGIRYTYGNNDGVFEFWTSDDYNEPFVWRSYDIGLDGTGNYQEWMKLVSKNLYVDGNLVHHRGNLNALTNATVSNDTITFTKSDGSTFSVTTSDANTNTWRPIDDTPVNGVTDQSISSNWAYDHANASNPHGITPANIGALASDAQAVDSDKLDGYHASTTRNAVNTIPVRDANGYLNLGWINTTSGNTTATITDFYVNTNDGYIRKATKAHVKSQLGLGSAAYVATSTFDAAGSAAAVDTRITEDIVPAIGAAQTTADNAATAAADALFDANKALQEVANIPTNNNQLTNGAGYLTATNDRVYITDSRGSARAPSYYNDRYAQWDFQNSADTGVGGDSWHGILTVSKWSSWNAAHRQEQLIFSGDHLWRRTASSDSAWGTSKKIWDSGNLDAFVGASVSNDTITFTKANGGTVAVTTSDANTNTWRGIHDVPVDGATTTSISSNWAFDNVKTPVPTNAKFTDTNTQLTDAQVRSKFSAGTNVAISATGVISSTYTNTWRPIDSTPTNGATGDSISSDWAYDNVRNFSSGGNSLAGSFTASGDITAFSDARVKENVETIHSALEKVTSMRGVTYNKIGDEKSSMGVIAQEIQEVAPEVVRENEDGMLSVAYGNITAVLIEAIKEQQKQIEELKSRLDGVTK